VDLDASGEAKDYRCGTLTYDGHNGTDFRVPTLAAQRAGVDVLAAADGRVLRRRDGMADVSIRVSGREKVAGSECGNGVVIAHGDGYETQYCHMAQGSIRVKPGDEVRAGQPIGRVGMSGLTEFPHLHFVVRRNGRVVDPYAPDAKPGQCPGGTGSLWAESLRQTMAYRPYAVVNAGFAAGPVTMEGIEEGTAAVQALDAGAAALVAFVRAVGLQAGDHQTLALSGPDGRVLQTGEVPPLDRHKAQYMMAVGLRRPEAGWPAGRYEATYTVRRGDKPVFRHSFVTVARP
jgi:hypothetical protein